MSGLEISADIGRQPHPHFDTGVARDNFECLGFGCASDDALVNAKPDCKIGQIGWCRHHDCGRGPVIDQRHRTLFCNLPPIQLSFAGHPRDAYGSWWKQRRRHWPPTLANTSASVSAHYVATKSNPASAASLINAFELASSMKSRMTRLALMNAITMPTVGVKRPICT